MQSMVFHSIHPHRLEGSQSNMQCDLRRLNATLAHPRQHFRREVQTSGWGSNRSAFPGVDRLIALAVAGLIGAVDVRGQRHVSQFLDQSPKISIWIESHPAFPKAASLDYFRLQLATLPKQQTLPYSDLSPRTYQTLPPVRLG